MDKAKIDEYIARAKPRSLIGNDIRWETFIEAMLSTREMDGEIWECGAYKGGTPMLVKCFLTKEGINKNIRIFDTFEGMPTFNPECGDQCEIGSFADTKYEEVLELFNGIDQCFIYKGVIPETFKDLTETKLAICHIDLDNYLSVKDCLEFCYPRVVAGGYIIIDDYNCTGTLGCKKATDDFLIDKPEKDKTKTRIHDSQIFFVKE